MPSEPPSAPGDPSTGAARGERTTPAPPAPRPGAASDTTRGPGPDAPDPARPAAQTDPGDRAATTAQHGAMRPPRPPETAATDHDPRTHPDRRGGLIRADGPPSQFDTGPDGGAGEAALLLAATRRIDAATGTSAAQTEDGFRSFAESVGAEDLSDILAAAAAYMARVEGLPAFSRRQVMRHAASLGFDDRMRREDGLRAFGCLLREGRIVRSGRGQFSLGTPIPHATSPGIAPAAL